MSVIRRVLFGPGRIAEPLRGQLAAEGLLAIDEELPGSVTYRHYRAPGEYSSWKREPTNAAIAVTRIRVVAWTGRVKHVDVPHNHPKRSAVTITSDRTDRLSVIYDAGAFRSDRSGLVEIRIRTRRAAEFVALTTR